MNNIEKTLKYYELIMVLNDLDHITNYSLPDGYYFSFWKNEDDTKEWIKIHINSGEFTNENDVLNYFNLFYKDFKESLYKRCFFIEFQKQKIATATLSPTDEFGYKCKIDWLAISKEFQGKHLAKPLISQCLSLAKNLGYSSILLHTQTHSWLAVKLYLDFGLIPYNVNKENQKGWQIIKTLTNHPSLSNFKKINTDEIFDELSVNIVKQLEKIHTNYTYEIWFKNNRNDVYVRENDNIYYYKFFDNGKTLQRFK